MLAVW
ncbi:hypothetical protein N7516_001584 [Penicillium verrucosum]